MLRFAPIIILLAFFQPALPQDTTTTPPWDVAPWPIEGKHPQPDFPDIGVKSGYCPSVNVRVNIDSTGFVKSVEIPASGRMSENLREGGFEVFEDAVKYAVKNWEFTPARKNGIPIPSTIEFAQRFVILKGLPRDTLESNLSPSTVKTCNEAYEQLKANWQSIQQWCTDSLAIYQPPPVLWLQGRVVSSSHP